MRLSAPQHQLKRRAKVLSRQENLPLHAALDRIAQAEGFAGWSLLAARAQDNVPNPAGSLLGHLMAGDRLLIGARPGQGKTLLGLRLLIEARTAGRRALFFSLDYTDKQARDRLAQLGATGDRDLPQIVTTDDISAETIAGTLAGAAPGTVAVIDYLQALDQQRSKPALGEQMQRLVTLARQTGTILGFVAQIDRRFDADGERLPELSDLRLPNPIPADSFTAACFLNAGQMRFERYARP